jgi:hypothetical protein
MKLRESILPIRAHTLSRPVSATANEDFCRADRPFFGE